MSLSPVKVFKISPLTSSSPTPPTTSKSVAKTVAPPALGAKSSKPKPVPPRNSIASPLSYPCNIIAPLLVKGGSGFWEERST